MLRLGGADGSWAAREIDARTAQTRVSFTIRYHRSVD
jgi:hypothetical protein